MAFVSAARLAHPVNLSAGSLACIEARQGASCFQAIHVGYRLPPAAVTAAASCSLPWWSLSQPLLVGRSTGHGTVVTGRYNQSFERTRGRAGGSLRSATSGGRA